MPFRVFVTGGSGFVGSSVIEQLTARGHSVNALSNRNDLAAGGDRVRTIRGGLFDSEALEEGMKGCQAVIHLVGIIMEKPSKGATFERIHVEGTRNVVDAARRTGIKRYLHMSALGTRSDAISDYHQTKFMAEQYVRASGLDWTIFRPSMIHGPNGEFMRMEAKWVRHKAPPFFFMPYFGAGPLGTGGAGLLQPVFVEDVARGFVDALENRQTIGEVYLLGGADRMTWPQLHHYIAEAIVGKRRWVLPLPAWQAKLMARLLPNSLLGFNRDQVIMSQEHNTCDLTKFRDDFGWDPQPFVKSLSTYATRL